MAPPKDFEQAYVKLESARSDLRTLRPTVTGLANFSEAERSTFELAFHTSSVELAAIDIGVLVMQGLIDAAQRNLDAQRAATEQSRIQAAESLAHDQEVTRQAQEATKIEMERSARMEKQAARMLVWQIAYVVLTAGILVLGCIGLWFQAHPRPAPITESRSP